MTEVLRVVEHVIAPAPPVVTMNDTRRGARRAIAGCGYWPDSADLVTYRTAVGAAGREIDRTIATWHRCHHRFTPNAENNIELAPPRLGVRYIVACELFQLRAERLKLLIDEPVAGCA